MRAIVVGMFIAATLAACDTTRSLSDSDRQALQQHEAQWHARSFHSYSFDYSQSSVGRTLNVHIDVQDDTVSNVVDIDTGQPPADPITWPTIDALFHEADVAVQQDNFTVSLAYDDQYGYLTLLSITSNNPGGGFVARASNLQPVN